MKGRIGTCSRNVGRKKDTESVWRTSQKSIAEHTDLRNDIGTMFKKIQKLYFCKVAKMLRMEWIYSCEEGQGLICTIQPLSE